jgi:hypothetical protein
MWRLIKLAYFFVLRSLLHLTDIKVQISLFRKRDYGRGDPLSKNWQKLALTSPTSSCRSVGIVSSRTKATGCLVFFSLALQPAVEAHAVVSRRGSRIF